MGSQVAGGSSRWAMTAIPPVLTVCSAAGCLAAAAGMAATAVAETTGAGGVGRHDTVRPTTTRSTTIQNLGRLNMPVAPSVQQLTLTCRARRWQNSDSP